MAKISGGTSHSTCTCSLFPRNDSLSGFREANQPEYCKLNKRANWDCRGHPGGNFTHGLQEREIWGSTGALLKPTVLSWTQIHTEKTDLTVFLHWQRVSGIDSPLCSCGQGLKIPKHVLVHCKWFQTVRESLEDPEQMDIRHLLCTEKGARKLSYWWLKHEVLQQFSLARALEIGVDRGD